MKKVIHATFHALKKVTPLYLAVLVVCGVLANAGVTLPGPMQWAYTPVEKTTAYASALAETFEQAQEAAESRTPVIIESETGVFWNTYVTNEGHEIAYVIRVPEGVTANMPLIVYLHDDEVTSIPELAQVGAVQTAEENNINSCIIIQPLSETSWVIEQKETIVRELTQHITSKFYCDESRVVLTGFDEGADGVWYYATLAPEYWTTISPVSAAPKTDMEPLIGKDINCHMVFGEYDVYAIKGDMNRVGKMLQENGATVSQIIIEQADHTFVRANAYDNDWFAWACQ